MFHTAAGTLKFPIQVIYKLEPCPGLLDTKPIKHIDPNIFEAPQIRAVPFGFLAKLLNLLGENPTSQVRQPISVYICIYLYLIVYM